MNALLIGFLKEEDGQDIVEYTLLIFFVVVTMAGLAYQTGSSVHGIVNTTDSNLGSATTFINR